MIIIKRFFFSICFLFIIYSSSVFAAYAYPPVPSSFGSNYVLANNSGAIHCYVFKSVVIKGTWISNNTNHTVYSCANCDDMVWDNNKSQWVLGSSSNYVSLFKEDFKDFVEVGNIIYYQDVNQFNAADVYIRKNKNGTDLPSGGVSTGSGSSSSTGSSSSGSSSSSVSAGGGGGIFDLGGFFGGLGDFVKGIFVPSDTYFKDKTTALLEKLKNKYGFGSDAQKVIDKMQNPKSANIGMDGNVNGVAVKMDITNNSTFIYFATKIKFWFSGFLWVLFIFFSIRYITGSFSSGSEGGGGE